MTGERNPSCGSTLYADAIAQRLSRETDRKASLESRAVTILTTSGLLATVLLGLATLSKQTTAHFSLPHASHAWVIVALILFTVAALGAVVTNSPFRYKDANPNDLQQILDEFWEDSPEVAERAVAKLHVTAFRRMFVWNQIKGLSLAFATLCEFGAIVCVAVAVAIAL